MGHEVRVVRVQALPTAAVRFRAMTAELRERMPAAYDEVRRYLDRIDVRGDGVRMYTRVHSLGEPLDIEAGFTVPAPVPASGRVRPCELPGGEAAMTELVGSYEGMAQAVRAVFSWLEDSGREASGGHWELYLPDEATRPPEELRTEIYLPLK